MSNAPLPVSELSELELLIRAHHPLVLLETSEEERAEMLFLWLAHSLGLPLFDWAPRQGLRRHGEPQSVYGTQSVEAALRHIQGLKFEALFHFRYADPVWTDAPVIAALAAVERKLRHHRGAVLLTGTNIELPPALMPLVARVQLSPPTEQEYYECVRGILADVRRRAPVAMQLNADQVGELLNHLRGLTLTEVRRILTQAMIAEGRLAQDTLQHIVSAKEKLVSESGVLEYFSVRQELDSIAGLATLKQWLRMRSALFKSEGKAQEFGLEPPRGLLLLGVQGCGKSLCAKAVASAWSLPLLRLDPGRLYNKYVGETERNLRVAIDLAERLAPLVLWVDEIEKAFATSDGDGGSTRRMLGTFLTWLQEKHQSVFVIATANDVQRLPPELLRKGRFDEIFFVDLPELEARKEIIRVHLRKRDRDPDQYDVDTLAALGQGYSGAELEQAIVGSLYSAFEQGVELSTGHVAEAIRQTVPLSVTMHEPIAQLRQWAEGRTVSAD